MSDSMEGSKKVFQILRITSVQITRVFASYEFYHCQFNSPQSVLSTSGAHSILKMIFLLPTWQVDYS